MIPGIDHTSHHLDHVLLDLADVLDAIPADRGGDPTPCTELDVAGLRAHVVGWLTAFTDGFGDEHGTCSDACAVQVEGTGAAQVRVLADRLRAVLPAAAQRPLRIGDAELPGEVSLAMVLWEYQVHGWDLARATGQHWAPQSDGIEASLAFAPGMLTEDYQGEGKAFAPRVEVPGDASSLDRLVALCGRDPRWPLA